MGSPHPGSPHGEVSGSVRRQRDQGESWAAAFAVVSTEMKEQEGVNRLRIDKSE